MEKINPILKVLVVVVMLPALLLCLCVFIVGFVNGEDFGWECILIPIILGIPVVAVLFPKQYRTVVDSISKPFNKIEKVTDQWFNEIFSAAGSIIAGILSLGAFVIVIYIGLKIVGAILRFLVGF